MGMRLLLVNKGLQTAQIFKDAAPTVKPELLVLETPELAARHIRDEKFDGVFVDTALPGFDRNDFTRRVRKSKFNSQAPIFLMTAYRGAGRAGGEAPGGVSWIVKPSSSADLEPFLRDLRRKLMAERRKHRRLSLRTTVNCVDGLRRFRGLSVNVSPLGMLLELSSAPRLGGEFEVYFHLASEDPVFRARVRVVRIEGSNRVALAFQTLDSIERGRLRRFLDLHLPALG